MSENVRVIDGSEYEAEVLRSPVPVLLDFFSTECAPCEALAPKYEAVAAKYAGKVRFLKIFRQGNRELASRLGVSSSPTVIAYRGGQESGPRLVTDIKRSELEQAVAGLVG